jgi:hypothetical protein
VAIVSNQCISSDKKIGLSDTNQGMIRLIFQSKNEIVPVLIIGGKQKLVHRVSASHENGEATKYLSF